MSGAQAATLLLLGWTLTCEAGGRDTWESLGLACFLGYREEIPELVSSLHLHSPTPTTGRRHCGGGRTAIGPGVDKLVTIPALLWPAVWPWESHCVSPSLNVHLYEMGSGQQPLPEDQRRRPGTRRPSGG